MPMAQWMSSAVSAATSARVVIPPAAVNSWFVASAKTAEPLEVGALEHAFFIYIGAQKSRAVGLKLCDDLDRGELGRLRASL